MRLLFINAVDTASEVETRYPPLGIGYLVSSLRSRFGPDAITCRIVSGAIENELASFKPDVVGISAVSQNYGRARAYARIAGERGLPVICGGIHMTMMPGSLTTDMTVGVVGEGEETICDLADVFMRDGGFSPAALSGIRGITYWDNGTAVTTPPRDPISPLDRIPMPARDLQEVRPLTYMFTSRGCPYRCTFCASSRFWNRIRYFSAERVVDEIIHVVDTYGVREINFYDDIFPANTKRVEDIVRLMRERGYLGTVDFHCAMRANLVKEKTVSLLKELGVRTIAMGLESGCAETLRYLKGGTVNVEDNERAVRLIKQFGITVIASFIIGSPSESREDILETLRFIKRSRIDDFDTYVLTPFPGTPVWDYALSRGLVSEEMDWNLLSIDFETNRQSAIILSERLTRDEIHELFLEFKREKKRRMVLVYLKDGLRHPAKIPRFLLRKIRELLA